MMSNMSYCRFRNTLGDLRDCVDHLDEPLGNLVEDEEQARTLLIELAVQIAVDYGELTLSALAGSQSRRS
jgi:hypothetical protein